MIDRRRGSVRTSRETQREVPLDPCRVEPDGLSPPDKNPADKHGPKQEWGAAR